MGTYLLFNQIATKNQKVLISTKMKGMMSSVTASVHSLITKEKYQGITKRIATPVEFEYKHIPTVKKGEARKKEVIVKVKLKALPRRYKHFDNKAKRLSKELARRFRFTKKQINNADTIVMVTKAFGASDYETNICMSIGFTETEFRNIAEYKGTRGNSKKKTGDYGKGVFQFTATAAKRKYGVDNPWNVGQSAIGCIRYIRANRKYFRKKGIKDGTRYMSELILAGYNAGANWKGDRCYSKIRRCRGGKLTMGTPEMLRRNPYTRRHVKDGMMFYRAITAG